MEGNDLFDYGPFPVLITERLILRQHVQADAEDLFVIWGDYEVQKYNSEPLPNVEAARVFIGEIDSWYAARKEVMWAVELRDRLGVVGGVDLHQWNRYHRRVEIGYSLARAWWGQGIASEAVQAVIDFGFKHMDLHRIEAMTIADNLRSVRMLERLGFRREGTRRECSWEDDGTFHDSAIYGLLQQETGYA